MEYSLKKGKRLTWLLRHDREAFDAGLIDAHGWRSVKELLTKGFSLDELESITDLNNKKRLEFDGTHERIRARQGHSIPVDVDLEETTPPDILYHGTARHYLESILEQGIVAKSRLYVHLSKDEETARNVGLRHEDPVILKVQSSRMHADGMRFFLSRNGVWLTERVPKEYLSVLD